MYEPALNPPYQTDLSYNVVGFTIDAPTIMAKEVAVSFLLKENYLV